MQTFTLAEMDATLAELAARNERLARLTRQLDASRARMAWLTARARERNACRLLDATAEIGFAEWEIDGDRVTLAQEAN
jgi:hypothetical protein